NLHRLKKEVISEIKPTMCCFENSPSSICIERSST
ncbi:MAG: hypothetical protein ACI9GZ_002884, partial [Bacteroidia bacterium]